MDVLLEDMDNLNIDCSSSSSEEEEEPVEHMERREKRKPSVKSLKTYSAQAIISYELADLLKDGELPLDTYSLLLYEAFRARSLIMVSHIVSIWPSKRLDLSQLDADLVQTFLSTQPTGASSPGYSIAEMIIWGLLKTSSNIHLEKVILPLVVHKKHTSLLTSVFSRLPIYAAHDSELNACCRTVTNELRTCQDDSGY